MGGSHIECVHTMLHFMHLKQCNVHVACNQKLVSSLIEKEKIKNILSLPDEISKKAQFKIFFQLRKYIKQNKIDTVIINTVELTIIRDLLFFLPSLNFVGIIHNAKKLEKSFTITKLVAGKVKKMLVLGNYLMDKIKPAPVFKTASFFPVYFPNPPHGNVTKPKDEYWIVIPGLATSARRDYAKLISEIANADNIPASFRFIFLGKYELYDIISDEIKESTWWKQHIIIFDGVIDYNTFHSWLGLSDIILPLLKIDDDDFYGDSRISGSFNLGFGYQKPFLLPLSYKKNTDLIPYSIYYEGMEGLINQLLDFVNNKKEQERIYNNYQNSPYNHTDQMADDIYNFIFAG